MRRNGSAPRRRQQQRYVMHHTSGAGRVRTPDCSALRSGHSTASDPDDPTPPRVVLTTGGVMNEQPGWVDVDYQFERGEGARQREPCEA